MALNIISLLSGTLFSFGLIISGMTNPKKVIGFLDIFGDWDYSLAFVMLGAIGVNIILMKFFKRERPVICGEYSLPKTKLLDKRLLVGSALFGIGWGIAGICPGPGVVNLTTFNSDIILFIVSLLGGMIIFKFVNKIIEG